MFLADALVAARDAASPEGFEVNIVVVATRLIDDERGLESWVEAMHQRTRDDLNGELQGSSTTTLAGREATLSVWVLHPEGLTLPLFQVDAMLMVESSNPRVSFLVQLHGTAPAGYAEHYGAIFRAVFDTLALG